MALWQKAVTDRNQSDIDRIKEYMERGWGNLTSDEQAEWLGGLKGALNRHDLERIESNLQFIADEIGVGVETSVGNIPDYPTESYFQKLLDNVETIRKSYVVHDDTPQTPTGTNQFTDINNIEKILQDIYVILQNRVTYYCGEMYAGENVGMLL